MAYMRIKEINNFRILDTRGTVFLKHLSMKDCRNALTKNM